MTQRGTSLQACPPGPNLTLPGVSEPVHQLSGGVLDGQASISIVHDNQTMRGLAQALDAVTMLLGIAAELRNVGQDSDDTHRINQDTIADCEGVRLQIVRLLLGDVKGGQNLLGGHGREKLHTVGQGESAASRKRWGNQLAVVGVDDYGA